MAIQDSFAMREARVRAAFWAASERSAGPLVFAALRAAADRSLGVRSLAAALAWRDSAVSDAAACPSRCSAVLTARERLGDTLAFGFSPASSARLALRRVSSEALPFSGGGRSTPARRAWCAPVGALKQLNGVTATAASVVPPYFFESSSYRPRVLEERSQPHTH